MDFVTWQDKYSVKIPSIDAQHKKLVAIINELYASMKTGNSKEQLGKTLKELVEYTKYHFSYEEELLEKAGYKDLNEHKEQHKAFVEKITATCKSYDEGKLFMSIDVCNFLQNWLINHIQGTDQKYSQTLLEHNIK